MLRVLLFIVFGPFLTLLLFLLFIVFDPFLNFLVWVRSYIHIQ